MSRNPRAESQALRQRVRDLELRLHLLAGAVVSGDPAAPQLARLLLARSTTLETGDVMPEAVTTPTR